MRIANGVLLGGIDSVRIGLLLLCGAFNMTPQRVDAGSLDCAWSNKCPATCPQVTNDESKVDANEIGFLYGVTCVPGCRECDLTRKKCHGKRIDRQNPGEEEDCWCAQGCT